MPGVNVQRRIGSYHAIRILTDTIAPEFARFVTSERRANRLPTASELMAAGDVSHPVIVENKQATELLRVAARRASGLFRPTKRSEVVWVNGDSELAVNLAGLNANLAEGIIRVIIPVRCDQIGSAQVEVVFAVGSPRQPAGLYASTFRRPNGPELIVSAWGDALVAFAWQCVLGMVSGIAGATGKDSRGNVLVPVELVATQRALQIVPMARHRFAGSSGLSTTAAKGSGSKSSEGPGSNPVPAGVPAC